MSFDDYIDMVLQWDTNEHTSSIVFAYFGGKKSVVLANELRQLGYKVKISYKKNITSFLTVSRNEIRSSK